MAHVQPVTFDAFKHLVKSSFEDLALQRVCTAWWWSTPTMPTMVTCVIS